MAAPQHRVPQDVKQHWLCQARPRDYMGAAPVDPDSGNTHVATAVVCLAVFILDAQIAPDGLGPVLGRQAKAGATEFYEFAKHCANIQL